MCVHRVLFLCVCVLTVCMCTYCMCVCVCVYLLYVCVLTVCMCTYCMYVYLLYVCVLTVCMCTYCMYVCVCVCVTMLMVTVQDTSGKEEHFEEKEYKYYIESVSQSSFEETSISESVLLSFDIKCTSQQLGNEVERQGKANNSTTRALHVHF